jgi:hypothetical protein
MFSKKKQEKSIQESKMSEENLWLTSVMESSVGAEVGAEVGVESSNVDIVEPIPIYEQIRKKIHRKIANAKAKRKPDEDDEQPRSKGQRKNTENLIVKSPIQKEFSFPVSSRSSKDTYTVTTKVIDGDFKLECNCGTKFKMKTGRSNCVHCMSVLLNLVNNTMGSVKNKKRFEKLFQFHKELSNVMDES